MNYQYLYLVWTILFFIIWICFFIYRKDVRKEMILVSTLFGFAGIISEIAYIKDWWLPLTVTNTAIGFEDFFIGFFIGGISAVIYEIVYSKKVKIKHPANIRLHYILALFAFIFLGSFYILKINSFYSTSLAIFTALILMLIKRKDLIKDSLISGLLTLIIGVIIYFILMIIQPGYIERFWYLNDVWYAKTFIGIPIAEYVWYFLIGMFIGPLYEYWQEDLAWILLINSSKIR
jgi:hypothetical protein